MRNYKECTPFDLGPRAGKNAILWNQSSRRTSCRKDCLSEKEPILRKWFVSYLLIRKCRFPNLYLGNPVTQPIQSAWGMCSEEHNGHKNYDHRNYAVRCLTSSTSPYFYFWWLMQEKYGFMRICWWSSSVVWDEKCLCLVDTSNLVIGKLPSITNWKIIHKAVTQFKQHITTEEQ